MKKKKENNWKTNNRSNCSHNYYYHRFIDTTLTFYDKYRHIDNQHDNTYSNTTQEHYKKTIVPLTNTVTNYSTMMIKYLHTILTTRTMTCPLWTQYLTCLTSFKSLINLL